MTLAFELPVRRLYADPRVRDCAGKVALARGPVIYCLEAADQEAPVFSLSLPRDAAITPGGSAAGLPDDIVCLRAQGKTARGAGRLYSETRPETRPCQITAIPYFAWANREKGDMTVWIRES